MNKFKYCVVIFNPEYMNPYIRELLDVLPPDEEDLKYWEEYYGGVVVNVFTIDAGESV